MVVCIFIMLRRAWVVTEPRTVLFLPLGSDGEEVFISLSLRHV